MSKALVFICIVGFLASVGLQMATKIHRMHTASPHYTYSVR